MSLRLLMSLSILQAVLTIHARFYRSSRIVKEIANNILAPWNKTTGEMVEVSGDQQWPDNELFTLAIQ